MCNVNLKVEVLLHKRLKDLIKSGNLNSHKNTCLSVTDLIL